MNLIKSLLSLRNNRLVKWVVVILVILSIVGIEECSKRRAIKATEETYEQANNQHFEETKKNGVVIATQKQLLVEKESLIAEHVAQIEKLSSIKSQVKYVTKYSIDTVIVSYKDSTTLVQLIDSATNDTSTYMKIPRPFENTSDSNFVMEGIIDTSGVVINRFEIIDSASVTIGDKRKNIFQIEPIVRIKHSNPYITTTSMNNVVVDPNLRKKTIHSFVIGVGVGGGFMFLVSTAPLIYSLIKK